MRALTFISLFAGIGGLDLGLERAGLRCVAQVEIDAYCQKVLAKHWPAVARYGDIRDCGAHNLPAADCLVGGFPCQDLSYAGDGAGIAGTRSGLWREYARLVGELRPRYVLVENVTALLGRGMGTVLGDLAACGYDAEWECLPAGAFGAPHLRDRLFVIAYPAQSGGCVYQTAPELHPVEKPQLWESFRTTDKRVWLTAHCGLRGDADGLPAGVDRLRGLGNAVVPQVAEYIGRALVAFDAQREVAA